MPDRLMAGSAWFVLAHILSAGVGLAGLAIEPSASVAATLKAAGVGWALVLWSIVFLVAGVGAAVARLNRLYLAETIAVDVMAGTFALWAVLVAVGGNGSAVQAGLGFLVTSCFMHGWARYRRRRLAREEAVSLRAVTRAAAAAAAQEAVGGTPC